MKKCLIVRYGAFGDMIIVTSLLRVIKELGYEVIVNTSERGQEILKNNPNVDRVIPYHTDSVPNDKLAAMWAKLIKKERPNEYLNLSESLELNIALHPMHPAYNAPKHARQKYFNANYYEYLFDFAGFNISIEDYGRLIKLTSKMDNSQEIIIPNSKFRGEMFFSEKEERFARETMKPDKLNIVWGLSGSGSNKAWPWFDVVANNVLAKNENVHIYFVGDKRCKILEAGWEENPRVTCLSGEISMRKSIALTKYASLVICPDTGLLHGAGCFSTPKIGLLGHSTIANVTKHFENDYSLEADPEKAECAPCSKLIYNASIQCPIEPMSNASFCMHYGLSPERVEQRINEVIEKIK